MLSILLFLLPPDSGEKMTLGVTILLAFFVNSLVVSNYTPEALSELPVIGIYYTFNIFLVAISVAESVWVLNVHFRGHKINRVPPWVKRLFRMDIDFLQKEKTKNDYFNKKILKYKNDFYIQKTKLKALDELSNLDLKSSNYSIGSDLNPYYLKKYALNNKNENGKTITDENSLNVCSDVNKTSPTTDETDDNLEKIFEIVSESFQLIQKDNLKLKKKKEILIEWKEVARRLDIILFIIATISITTTPILLFAKFYFRSDSHFNKHHQCGCYNS